MIVIPTWGMGIWRSEDGGDTWAQSPNITDEQKPELVLAKNVISLFAYEGDAVIYGTDKASAHDHYMLRSFDYGKTWQCSNVGESVFNPWTFHKRMYNGVETYYFGGERGGNSVMKSIDGGVTWEKADSPRGNNRCIIGKNDGPLFVMFSQDGVYVSKNDGASLTELGTGLVITNANNKSLTHMVMTDDKLYCSAQEDGIQMFDISNLDGDVPVNVENIEGNKLSIYPNPVENYMLVPADQESSVTVLDMRGSVLRQNAGTENRIDISDFSSGVYMVRYQQNGILRIEKVVKK